jgi:hypothetical protein
MIDETKMTTVYHVSWMDYLDQIKSKGLKSFYDTHPEYRKSDSIRERVDCWFNKLAPQKIDRRKRIYAFPSKEEAQKLQNVNQHRDSSPIFLSFNVDPTKTLVADVSHATKAFNLLAHSEYAPVKLLDQFARDYWNSTMTLEQYSQLDLDEKKEKISSPEVLVHGPIETRLINFGEQ